MRKIKRILRAGGIVLALLIGAVVVALAGLIPVID